MALAGPGNDLRAARSAARCGLLALDLAELWS
jgi:hypothetical protein